MDTQRTMLVMCLSSAMLPGCTPPEIHKTEYQESATSEDGGSDEFGPAREEEGEGGGEISQNACLLEPDGGDDGYRHHCGAS